MAGYVKAFHDWVEQMSALDDAERGRLFVAILEYDRTGEPPELEGNERFLFPVFKAQIDRDSEKMSEISAKKAEAGKAGGVAKAGKGKQKLANVAYATDATESVAEAGKAGKGKQTVANKEKEKEEENNKDIITPPYPPKGERTVYQTLEALLPSYGIPDPVKDKVREWVRYKAERKQGYKEQGLKALLRQIETNTAKYGQAAMCDIIDKSMANGWQGIIFDRLKEPQYSPAKKAGTYDPSVYENAPKFGWGDD